MSPIAVSGAHDLPDETLRGVAVTVHLGAHKTATTYMQAVFAGSLPQLGEVGVAYLPLNSMRMSVTRQVWTPNEANFSRARGEIRRRMAATVSPTRRLLLSDENLIGNPVGRNSATLYAHAKPNLRTLVRLLGDGVEPEFFLAVRSYERFVPSLYTEAIRHRPFLSFKEYLSAIDLTSVSWHRLVAEICEVVSARRLTLWDFDDFSAIERTVFDAIVPEMAGVALTHPDGPVRPSASDRAIRALTALRDVLDADEVQKVVIPVSEAVHDGPAFAPFSERTIRRLRRRFADDVGRVRRDFPDVRWLGR
jgi:hypothetical protein